MKTTLFTKIILAATILLTSFTASFSQPLQVTDTISAEEMVGLLIGSGLEYGNVTFTGATISRGSFWGGPGNIGVSNGIILTSGSVYVAPGPNNQGGASYNANTGGDPDLSALSGANSYDACVLEFDFVPYYDYMWFQFVFLSEEYHEYVNMGFNDVFGFFISGPGISGPYSNNAMNIALIPGTSLPVSINNVNNGPNNLGPCTNCQYFVNNTEQFTQYDAFTTVLTAESEVVPMSTYHIKLAVGDILDHSFDSGVLLQASSFCSGPQAGIAPQEQEMDAENFSVYPIPAGDLLNIANSSGENYSVQLVGQDGRVVQSARGNTQLSLDISMVPCGLYILRITTDDRVTTRKIFKQ